MRMRAVVVALAATRFLTSATWWRTSAQTAIPALAADPAQGSRAASTASLDGIVEGSDQKPIARACVVFTSPAPPLSDGSSLGDSLTGDVHADGSFRIVSARSGASFGAPVTVLPKDVRKQDLIETHAAVLTRAIVR